MLLLDLHATELATSVHLVFVAQLESVTQCFHVRVVILHELERIGDNSHWPRVDSCKLAGLEA